MCIGRIVTDDQTLRMSDFIEVVPSSEYKNDGTISLIVGKDTVKELFPEYNLKYLDRKIDDNNIWTFSKFEKRNVYEYDIKNFKNFVFNKVFGDVKYSTLDLIYMKLDDIRKYYEILNNDIPKYVYVCEKSLYIYYNNMIYGISLDEFLYIGITCERLIRTFKSGKNVKMIFSDKFIDDNYVKSNPKYVPYLYFISNS